MTRGRVDAVFGTPKGDLGELGISRFQNACESLAFFFSHPLQRSIFNSVKLNNNVFKLFKNNDNCFVNICDHNQIKKYFKIQFLIEMIKFDSLNPAEFRSQG